MRKHLLVASAVTGLVFSTLVGCSSDEYTKQSEPRADKQSEVTTTPDESTKPASKATETKSPTPAKSPTPTATSDATCSFDDSWSTDPIDNFGNQVPGDVLSGSTDGKIYAIDTGQHDCFDRIVVRVDTDQEVGYRAEYVDVVRTPGKGDPVELQGNADLRILVQAWTTNTDQLNSLNVTSVDWPVLHQVVQAGSFEGQTTIAVGVDHQAPFRVFYLPADDNTMRVVIDIAHQ